MISVLGFLTITLQYHLGPTTRLHHSIVDSDSHSVSHTTPCLKSNISFSSFPYRFPSYRFPLISFFQSGSRSCQSQPSHILCSVLLKYHSGPQTSFSSSVGSFSSSNLWVIPRFQVCCHSDIFSDRSLVCVIKCFQRFMYLINPFTPANVLQTCSRVWLWSGTTQDSRVLLKGSGQLPRTPRCLWERHRVQGGGRGLVWAPLWARLWQCGQKVCLAAIQSVVRQWGCHPCVVSYNDCTCKMLWIYIGMSKYIHRPA